MRYLLDTSALIAHHRREPGWPQVQAIFEEASAEVLVASVSLTEFGRRLHALGLPQATARQCLREYRMLFSAVVSVDERGQMVLPKELREKADIKPGDKLAVISWEKDGRVCCISLINVNEFADMVKSRLGPVLKEIVH